MDVKIIFLFIILRKRDIIKIIIKKLLLCFHVQIIAIGKFISINYNLDVEIKQL